MRAGVVRRAIPAPREGFATDFRQAAYAIDACTSYASLALALGLEEAGKSAGAEKTEKSEARE